MKNFFRQDGHWLLLLLLTDLTFVLLTWILRPDALGYVAVFVVLYTALTALAGWLITRQRRSRQLAAARRLLEETSERNYAALCAVADSAWLPLLETAFTQSQQRSAALSDKQTELVNYRESIEEWTHEIKTPLSLMTLVLENHTQEISPYVAARMQYAVQRIGQDVERILYYARLQAEHADYRFTRFALEDCVRQTLAEFAPIAAERRVQLETELAPATVVCDRKVLEFLLSQLLSNAVKYADREHGRVLVRAWQDDEGIHLCIRDNGAGAAAEDLPFLFDKGFTGSHPERQKATGMGLYLVGKYADALAITVRPETKLASGFGMELVFPLVEEV